MYESFFECDRDDLDIAPFDIETTGFETDKKTTVAVMYHQNVYHIWLNTDGDDVNASELTETVKAESGITSCVLHLCPDETSLIENVRDYATTAFTDKTLVLAYNGGTWDGGFDNPFWRTRAHRLGVKFPFRGFWFTDPYEVIVQNGVFNTTVKDEPSLEGTKKTDLEQFVDDTGLDVQYDSMRKREIVKALEEHDDVTLASLASWADEDTDDPPEVSSYKSATLKSYIDDKSLDISYNRLKKDDLITAIRQSSYTETMLQDWHEETGRDIGSSPLTELDDIHEDLFETEFDNDDFVENNLYEIERFEPFDPYDDSGKAVTAYMNKNYEGVILHCLADVAKTVNLSRMMIEHAPQSDYKPTIL